MCRCLACTSPPVNGPKDPWPRVLSLPRAQGGLLETPPCWHATIYIYSFVRLLLRHFKIKCVLDYMVLTVVPRVSYTNRLWIHPWVHELILHWYYSPGIMAPQGGYLKVCAIFEIVPQWSFMMSPEQPILVEIYSYYQKNLNIAPGLGHDPHNA